MSAKDEQFWTDEERATYEEAQRQAQGLAVSATVTDKGNTLKDPAPAVDQDRSAVQAGTNVPPGATINQDLSVTKTTVAVSAAAMAKANRETTKAQLMTDERGVLNAQDLDSQWRLANALAQSGSLGPAYNNKPGAILMAMNLAMEKGKGAFSFLHSSYEVKGRITEWGSDPLGAVFASGLVKEFRVMYVAEDGKIIDEMDFKTPVWAVAAVGERTEPPIRAIRYFTADDAVRAKLADKDTYKQYHRRMYETKAVGALLKIVWPDVIAGIPMPEYDEHVPSNGATAPTGMSAKEKLTNANRPQAPAAGEGPTVSGVLAETVRSLPRPDVQGDAAGQPGEHGADVQEAPRAAAQTGVVQVPAPASKGKSRAPRARVDNRAAPLSS